MKKMGVPPPGVHPSPLQADILAVRVCIPIPNSKSRHAHKTLGHIETDPSKSENYIKLGGEYPKAPCLQG